MSKFKIEHVIYRCGTVLKIGFPELMWMKRVKDIIFCNGQIYESIKKKQVNSKIPRNYLND